MMTTEVLPTTHPNAIPRALNILQNGGIIAFPTDTVYGLAAATFSASSIEKLYEAKTREAAKAIAVLVGDLPQVDLLTTGMSPSARRLAGRFWPGALTLVVPKHPKLPPNLSPYPTVGLRMPNHLFALDLLKSVGPLATTSANRSGAGSTITPEDVLAQLAGRIDLLLDGGACPGGVPSTVVDCTQSPPVILRPGAISLEELSPFLSDF
jgi:L-threonylcarbamoyladenylate synthase